MVFGFMLAPGGSAHARASGAPVNVARGSGLRSRKKSVDGNGRAVENRKHGSGWPRLGECERLAHPFRSPWNRIFSLMTRRKGRYIRKHVPGRERVASLVVLILLAGIGGGVYLKGQHYDPDMYQLDERDLAVGPSVPEEDAAPGTGSFTAASGGGDGNADQDPNRLAYDVEGLAPMAETEHYPADRIYEKINGRADAYHNYDVVDLSFRSFMLGEGGTRFLDVYRYDMGTPRRAFGIFASQRDPEAPVMSLVEHGYWSGASLFFRRGKYYYELIASENTEALREAAERLAGAIAERQPADRDGLQALEMLPEAGRVEATVSYQLHDALGMSFLEGVFLGEYAREGGRFKFFLAPQQDPDQAAEVFTRFKEFSGNYGKIQSERVVAGAELFEAESYGMWDFVFQREAMVGGVTGTESPEAARGFVEQYLRGELE